MVDFIKTHKTESIIASICIMLFLFTIIFLKIFFFSEKSSIYGTRLEGIDVVKISQDKLDKIAIDIKKDAQVTKVESNVTGKIINILITVNAVANSDAIKVEANTLLGNFNKKEKKFYDIQVFLVSSVDSTLYPTIGYKGKSSNELIWIHS